MLICRHLRCDDMGDISAMIEDISQDHQDRMHMVIALNAGQCRIATPMVSTSNRAWVSRNIFCKACDQGFNVAPDPPKGYFVRRIGRQRG